MLKVCIEAIEKNSHERHQIVLHINEGEDGTLTWANQMGYDYTQSAENVGICHAMNAAAELATQPWLLYLNDDMYVCPGWDMPFMEAISASKTNKIYLSGTVIEPIESGNNCVIAPHDFGRDVDEFKESELLKFCQSVNFHDWQGATWPPSLMHRDLWDAVGGFSLAFSPGMYSDPDLSLKLYHAGVRDFKGLGKSLTYHFMSKSTGRIQKNDGRKQFFQKWGISASTWTGKYLKRGEPYRGPLKDMKLRPTLKDRLKRLLVRE